MHTETDKTHVPIHVTLSPLRPCESLLYAQPGCCLHVGTEYTNVHCIRAYTHTHPSMCVSIQGKQSEAEWGRGVVMAASRPCSRGVLVISEWNRMQNSHTGSNSHVVVQECFINAASSTGMEDKPFSQGRPELFNGSWQTVSAAVSELDTADKALTDSFRNMRKFSLSKLETGAVLGKGNEEMCV